MKTLNIKSPTAQHLAQIALFERLQAMLNLQTSEIVKKLRKHGKKNGVDPLALAGDLHFVGPFALGRILDVVAIHIRTGEKMTPAQFDWFKKNEFATSICDHFGWTPNRFANGIKSKAKSEGFDPVQAAEYLALVCPDIAAKVFVDVIGILRRDGK
jgi:hypothetical protein